MPPATVLSAVVRMPNTNGLTEDLVENVFNFGSIANPLEADVGLLMDAISDFYTLDQGAGHEAPGALLSPSVSRAANAASILVYQSADLSGATPFGSPINSKTFTLPASTSASGLPSEVSLVISYRGDIAGIPVTQTNPSPPPATIRPQQRRRGRLYFGPLNIAQVTTVAGQSRPTTTTITSIKDSFNVMVGDVGSIVGGFYFGVWSRTDEDVYEYEAGYIDNAWDTQRRRGVDATVRTLL